MLDHNYKGMSAEAWNAYLNDAQPISYWHKKNILYEIASSRMKCGVDLEILKTVSVDSLKEMCLSVTCVAETGNPPRDTQFYSVDPARVAAITMEDIAAAAKKKPVAITDVPARCSYLDWSEFPTTGRAKRIEEEGIIRGKTFYGESGSRKKIDGKGFRVIEKTS